MSRLSEIEATTVRAKAATKHGHTSHNWRSPTYRSWDHMQQRCGSPKASEYQWYGGRGIRVCERWSDFVNFLSDMGVRPVGTELDRIDTNGHYEPGNCRWVTHKVNCSTQRSTMRLTHDGRTQMLCEWAAESGIPAITISHRLKIGLPLSVALKLGNLRPRQARDAIAAYRRSVGLTAVAEEET